MLYKETTGFPGEKVQVEEVLFQPTDDRVQSIQLLYWQQRIEIQGSWCKIEEGCGLRDELYDVWGCTGVTVTPKNQIMPRANLFDLTATGVKLTLTKPSAFHKVERGTASTRCGQ
jgi:hypothetical protein